MCHAVVLESLVSNVAGWLEQRRLGYSERGHVGGGPEVSPIVFSGAYFLESVNNSAAFTCLHESKPL